MRLALILLLATPDDPIVTAAREIDRLVEADMAANGATPNPPLDDAGFVRRIYLDILGRIPTEREFAAAMVEGREALIDRLLASPGSSSHLFNWWADLLRVKASSPACQASPTSTSSRSPSRGTSPWTSSCGSS
jgi:hypothetical protein